MPIQPPWRAVIAVLVLAVWPMAPSVVQAWAAWPASPVDVHDALDHLYPLTAYAAGLTLLLALSGRARHALWLLLPATVLALPELFYVAAYGLPSGAHVFGILAETDTSETLAFVGPWWPWALAAWLALVVVTAWSARQWWRADWRWRHRSRYWVLAAGAALLTGAALDHQPRPEPGARPAGQGLHTASDGAWAPYWADLGLESRLEGTFPWGLPWRLRSFADERAALHRHRYAAGSHDFGVRPLPDAVPSARQVHVLVIGESSRPDRWRLYGAERPTTPGLSDRGDLIVFGNAVSAAAATRESVPLMLTRRPPSAMLSGTGEPSLLTAFRQAGFRSHWLSTQGTLGEHDTPLSVLAAEADSVQHLNASDYRGHGAWDGVLLAPLWQRLAAGEARQLIVLHTLGSHLNYAHRYPPAFERFQPALQPQQSSDIWTAQHQAELVNAYDNSLLYTDWLLSQVIAELSRSGAQATLSYVADHGETLFDGRCKRAGHGFASLANYRVPWLVWLSPAWIAAHPERAARLRERRLAPVSTLALFPTLAGLAGFSIAAPSAHADLGGPQWQASPREVVHFGDFDHGVRARACDG